MKIRVAVLDGCLSEPRGRENRMQSLDLVDRLLPAVLSGEKRATIRWREAAIRLGPLRLVCIDDPARDVTVEVWRVTPMALCAVAGFLGRAGDWPDPVMLAGMREHYPAITLDAVVQVIEFHPPRRG